MDALQKIRNIQAYMNEEITDDGVLFSAKHAQREANFPQSEPPSNCDQPQAPKNHAPFSSIPIHYAALPNGKRIPLLKTALTTACERNCNYCAFRTGRDFKRQSFQPEELADAFMNLFHAGVVEGLFLSSAVAGGGVRTQDRLLAVAEILRHRHQFVGYLHLKIMPGAEKAQVERGMQLADRVSVNLEAPTTKRLEILAPGKHFIEELLQPLRWVEEIRRTQPAYWGWKNRWPSSTTQFVVGAVDERDIELLQISAYLHKKVRLSRAYFSGFNPIKDTPLEHHPAVHPMREVRLYQASYLIRDYEFNFEELDFNSQGNLSLTVDPKLAWAQTNLEHAPLEINKADYHQLLRIPGIGPLGAKRILSERIKGCINQIGALKRLGIFTQRAAPYILLNGKRPPLQIAFPF